MNVASIDIGSNTVLLLIAKVELKNKTFSVLRNEHRMPRISKGLSPGKPISSENVKRLKNVLAEYKSIIELYDVQETIATATNAFRISSNSATIINEIRNDFGLNINIISGDEEAYYSFLGATSGISNRNNILVIDIGGGSTEIILGSRNKINFRKSYQIGAVSATEQYFLTDPPTSEHIENLNNSLLEIFSELNTLKVENTFPIAIAGTPTTLSCIKHKLNDFDENIIELSTLTLNDLDRIKYDLSVISSTEIKNKWPNIMRGREDIILAGASILFNIIKLLKLDKVYTSTKGIRYGAIVKYLNDIG
jgi:exopolyphosphatase/guanosine-5'-triphosphate,3'-diphosphate pyrophosphatase